MLTAFTRGGRLGLGSVALALVLAWPAGAQTLSEEDRALYRRALEAARDEAWDQSLSLGEQGSDALATKIVRWNYLRAEDSGAPFRDIMAFLDQNPGWPARADLRARAEAGLPLEMSGDEVVAFFKDTPPSTPAGKLRLGEALLASGKTDEGRKLVEAAWIEADLSAGEERAILARIGQQLGAGAHEARLARLLYGSETEQARRMLDVVEGLPRLVGETRLAIQSGRNPTTVFRNAPPPVQADPGVLFDKARWLRRSADRDAEGREMLLRVTEAPDILGLPVDWWEERHVQARRALAEAAYSDAYALAAGHGQTRGTAFAEGEFLAGWIALRFLRKPEAALGHFRTLEKGVSSPISLSRAFYWQGRALDVLKKPEDAEKAFRAAARYPETFYGQIAAANLDKGTALSLRPEAAKAADAAFAASEMGRAIVLLDQIGSPVLLNLFAQHIADTAEDAATVKALGELLTKRGHTHIAVRVGKRALQRDLPLASIAYPSRGLPSHVGQEAAPERALVLALMRQESEFNETAVSGAGAMGLMQVMPETGRATAKRVGLRFPGTSALVNDPEFNMQLGMAYLARRLEEFDGSYILTLAAYNAGAGRVNQWLATYGDPRMPGTDPVDWVELIPFSETRNYVQRVLENTQIYRNRLAGKDTPLLILDDLRRTSAMPRPGTAERRAEAR